MFVRKIRSVLIFALGIWAPRAVAVPVHVSFDWPRNIPASASAIVHVEAVQTAGPNAMAQPIEADSAPQGMVLNLGAGVWRLQASVAGYWSQGTDVEVTQAAPLDLRLALWPAASLHGILVTAGGEPLPETITLRLSSVRSVIEEKNRSLKTVQQLIPGPSRGELQCRVMAGIWNCLLPAGVFDIRLEAAGYTPRYAWGVNLKAAESTDFGRTELLRTASVFGRVLRKDGSNAPLPCRATLGPNMERRTPVDSYEAPENMATGQTTSPVSINPRGFFQIVGVAPGRYVLVVACPDASGFRELRVQADTETRLDPPLQLEELTLYISTIPSTDPAGQPWKLTLYATSPHYLMITDGANTGTDGRWTRHGLMAGNYHVVVRNSNGTEWLQKYFDLDKNTGPLTLSLGSVSVAGRVTMNSQPVHARLLFTNDNGGSSATLMSDVEGRFQGLLPTGRAAEDAIWTVEAHIMQPPATQRVLGVRVRPASGNAATWLDLELPAIPVRGIVVSPDGKPQYGVQVTFENSSGIRTTTSTDTNGKFEMLDLPAGAYTAVADSGEGSSDRTPFKVTESGGSELKLVLHPFKRYSFSVVSNQGPVEGAAVQVWIKPGVTWAFSRTDENGRFEVSLPPGTPELGLTIGAPGYAIKLTRLPITSDGTESPDANTITLSDSGATLVLNFKDPGVPENPEPLYIVHNGSIQDARTIAGWGTSNPGTLGEQSAVVDAIEPGAYALCPATNTAELAALWSGPLPSSCIEGSVDSGETLTLTPR